MAKLEKDFQAKLIKRIESELPGSYVIKQDANYIQGLPDLLIVYKNRWAMLENKRSKSASKRPNQEYYISKFNEMSFASFISPETEQEVLDGLYKSLRS